MTHKTRIGNILASYKGSKEWEFYGYIDHGKIRKNVRCECGQPLRYQFLLKNKITGVKKSLGVVHLQDEMKFSSNIAKAVFHGIHQIDYDLDEILNRFRNCWKVPSYIETNLSELPLTKEMSILLKHGLPLLERHVDYLAEKGRAINIKKGIARAPIKSRFDDFPRYVSDFVLCSLDGYDYEVYENRIIARKEDYLKTEQYTIIKEDNVYQVLYQTIDKSQDMKQTEKKMILTRMSGMTTLI